MPFRKVSVHSIRSMLALNFLSSCPVNGNHFRETTTAELARTQNAQGFKANKSAAELSGKIAGGARKNIEDKIGRSVVTKQNFLKNNKQINLGNEEE